MDFQRLPDGAKKAFSVPNFETFICEFRMLNMREALGSQRRKIEFYFRSVLAPPPLCLAAPLPVRPSGRHRDGAGHLHRRGLYGNKVCGLRQK